MANYVELLGFDLAEGSSPAGSSIRAARVRDVLSGESFTIPARTVINATGAWAGKVEAMAGRSNVVIKPAKGVHLTLPREALPTTEYAVVLPETPDGRLLFIVPWNTRVTLGTTDTKGGDIEQPVASDADIDYLIDTANAYLRTKINRSQVISVGGLSAADQPGRRRWRDQQALAHTRGARRPGGMITITGGKLTSYRRMAQDTIDHLDKRLGKIPTHPTEALALDGKDGYEGAATELGTGRRAI